MPLLLCPNDNAAMTSVQRSGVEFDMCPTCRGVWLDRGELEKLIASAQEPDAGRAEPAAPRFLPRDDDRGRSRDDDDYRPGQYNDDYAGGRRKKRSSFLDIFD